MHRWVHPHPPFSLSPPVMGEFGDYVCLADNHHQCLGGLQVQEWEQQLFLKEGIVLMSLPMLG